MLPPLFATDTDFFISITIDALFEMHRHVDAMIILRAITPPHYFSAFLLRGFRALRLLT